MDVNFSNTIAENFKNHIQGFNPNKYQKNLELKDFRDRI